MAHDFSIRIKDGIWKKKTKLIDKVIDGEHFYETIINEKYKDIPSDEAFFYGFAEGIFYEAFHCEHHAMLFSGDGENIVINYQTALNGLKTAIQRFSQIDYPDPNRINEIKEFYERMKTDYINIKWFEICFG